MRSSTVVREWWMMDLALGMWVSELPNDEDTMTFRLKSVNHRCSSTRAEAGSGEGEGEEEGGVNSWWMAVSVSSTMMDVMERRWLKWNAGEIICRLCPCSGSSTSTRLLAPSRGPSMVLAKTPLW